MTTYVLSGETEEETYIKFINTMCTTPDFASEFGFSDSYHAHKFQPLKPQLLEADLLDLFSFIWARDTYGFDHPRYRLQVAFSILLIFHLGLHPNIALKEGLYYSDTKNFLTRLEDATRAILVIRLDNRDEDTRVSRKWSG
jgi:hypothetical protein